MKKGKKIRFIIILTLIVAVLGYAAFMCFYYFFYYEYKQYLTQDYTYEVGTEFKPLEDSDPKVKGMVLAAENDILKLYTNTKTTEIAVYDKRTGVITYSNPVDRAEDTIATGKNKIALNSQFMVTYYDSSRSEATMYNYDLSVEREQYEIEKIENGIRYIYLLGDLTNPTGLVPPLLTPERLNELQSRLDEKDARTLRNAYKDSDDHPGFKELTAVGSSSKVGLQKLNAIMEKMGYTQEDYDADAAVAAGGEVQIPTTFSIPLEYRLVDDKLEVSIPTGNIKETGVGKIGKIDLLCYFGAGGLNEQGYLLVPNGSGSLIYFNNGKKNDRYNQFVYGQDETTLGPTVVEKSIRARMPVFGIKRENSAIFAEITNGDTLANIMAMVSGSINSYNYAYPSFTIRGSEKVSMFDATGAGADVPTVEKDIYKMNLTVDYAFLNNEDASYSGMANYYRNKLISKGVLKRLEPSDSIPFYLDILGGVKRQESFVGVAYMDVFPMTKFKEASTIVDAFTNAGVSNIRLNYLGWFNGGYYHDVAKRIKVDKELGSKKDLIELSSKLESAGNRFYGDVALNGVSFEAEGIGYNWRIENSQYYSGLAAGFAPANPATMRMNTMGYFETGINVLSPKFLVRHVNGFLNASKKVDIYGISLRDLGDFVASDKRRSNVINRQESKQIVVAQMDRIDKQIGNLMISGGNAYAWAFADDLVNVPASHNAIRIVDEEIPFYEMVIHGCIDYAASAINLNGSYDKRDAILRMLEYGFAPHFVLSYQNSSEIKYTGMNSYFSTQYEIWLDEAVDMYNQLNDVLKHVNGSTIKEHAIIEEGIKRITYDNGCVIYINSTDEDAQCDGITIPARNYVLEGV